MRMCFLVALAACGKDPRPPAVQPVASDAVAPAARCTQLPFGYSTPVPEASGAAWMTIDDKLALVVISDSGNHGKYAIVDPETGVTREQGKLPLGGGGEDLEGAAVRGGKLVVVTSPGWIRIWERVERGFKLVEGPYPLGPIDLEKTTDGNSPPEGNGMVCDVDRTNCGRNYEGLCLAPASSQAECVGFVASKADGHLYCVVERAGRLVALHDRAIKITRPGALADCAFAEDGTLYAGSNLFDVSRVYRVEGWADPATAKVTEIDQLGIGFPETLAVRGDIIYRMSDTGGGPSLMAKFRCSP
ncbi:MAG: hypothetical protein WKG01_12675 [Kofleriaceae bacterium]